ncbi:MAG TPA: alpha-hydroxy acid oxidase [Bryobacteraceae bacterium]|nr:alpha-hydroxy acid oxidase [Bryobacteraceae bacterium]
MTRREAARQLSLLVAGSPLLRGQDPAWIAPRLPGIDELNNVLEFEPLARTHMLKAAYDYIAGGVDDEWTLRRNRQGFERITFRPRMLVDVSRLDLSLDLFGSRIEMPILIAPTAGHQQAHPEGEVATVKGAGAARTIMVVSSNSSYPIDKIGAAATGPFWFQLYAEPDKDGARDRVERAVAAGAKAICWTVDGPYGSHRERLLRDRLASGGPPGEASSQTGRRRSSAPPPRYGLRGLHVASLTWPFLQELKSWSKVPVLVKGILTPADALLAVENGAAGIVVSNHGARYLDGAPSTIEALPGIVDAVRGRLPVLIDGGFRRGTDVLKALAIGAKAVLVGRPPLFGLGAFGQAGVQRVMEMLQSELALAMGLSGKPNLAAIDRTLVRIEPY